MSAPLLTEAYVYMATTTDMLTPWNDELNLGGKYIVPTMRIHSQAWRYMEDYGICVKIGSTTMHPSIRAKGLAREKGMAIVKTQTLQTTQSNLLLIESLLRSQLEAYPLTQQIGTDTFQVFTDNNRELILSKWEELVAKALKIANMI